MGIKRSWTVQGTLWRVFPNNDENKVIQSFLRDRYREYPEVISKLGKEKETLKED